VGTGDAPVTIGNSADGRQVRALAMAEHVTTAATATTPAVATSALVVLDGNGLGVISNPKACGGTAGTCNAAAQTQLANTVPLPLIVQTDNTVGKGAENSLLYIGDTTGSVFKWDLVSGAVTTVSTGFSFPTAVGIRNTPTAALWVGDDPSQGNSIGAGHIYQIP
jgi:hypothetical protein